MALSVSQKRKRSDSSSETYTVVLSSKEPSELGPVVASFPSADPPPGTPFRCYYADQGSAARKDELDFAQQNIFLVGETKDLDFVTYQGPTDLACNGAKYVLGLRSKSSKTITIRECPLHIFSRDVKRLKSLGAIKSSNNAEERMAQRAKLGDAFGTKKAQKAIRARERNQVDVSAMEGVLGLIGEGVEGRTESLPTAEKAKEILDTSRLIPTFDASSTNLEGVYPIHSLLLDIDLRTIQISPLLVASGHIPRTRLLPFSRSSFINGHLEAIDFENGQPLSTQTTKRLRLLVYASSIFALHSLRHKLFDESNIHERLKTIARPVVDSLLQRFTETARDSTKPQMTSNKETLLLTTLFAVTLHIDNFIVESSVVAKDLSMSVATVNQLYKSLGCKIDVPSSADCARAGVDKTRFNSEKRAILRLPLTFPKARSRKKRK